MGLNALVVSTATVATSIRIESVCSSVTRPSFSRHLESKGRNIVLPGIKAGNQEPLLEQVGIGIAYRVDLTLFHDLEPL